MDRLPRIEEHLVVLHHALVAAPLRVLVARKGVADRRAHRDVGDGGVDVRRGGKRNGIVARIARTHRQELRDVTAARGCVDADLRAVAVPGRGIHLEPAHGVVGVLHAGRIGRFGRDRHVDGDDQQAARGQRAIHRLFGQAVFSVPGAAVQIENGRERSRPLRLVDPRHQHPAGAVAPKLDFADGKIEAGGGIIRGRAGRMSGAGPETCHGRQTVTPAAAINSRTSRRTKVPLVMFASLKTTWLPNDRLSMDARNGGRRRGR